MRQHALLDANQEDVLELQPLGGVQRRQLHGVGPLVAVLFVEQVDERDHLRQFDQVLAVFLAFLGEPLDEFLHVVPARQGDALVVLVVQPGFVADGGEQVVHHFLDRLFRSAVFEAIDELAEFKQRPELARLHAMRETFLEGGGEQRNVPLAGVGAERFER